MSTLFSTQSRKAWVAGALSALLTPVLNLLTGVDVITVRSLVVAVAAGLAAAVAVWATDNATSATVPPPTEPTAVPPAATGPQTASDFSDQTVE